MSNLPKKLSEIKSPGQGKKAPVAKKTPQTNKISDPDKKKSTNSSYPVITKIETQKTKGRYNLYLDDQFALGVNENVLIKYLLRKGMEVSPELLEDLKNEENFQKAYSRALTYLSYGLRSEKEVRTDLKDKDFTSEVDRVVAKLKDQAYIDDAAYAQAYIQHANVINRKGPQQIVQELRQNGVDEFLAEDTIHQHYSFDDQLNNAVFLADKQVKKAKRKSTRQAEQKVYTYLLQKGYSKAIIQEAMEKIDTEKTPEEEMFALRKEGEKAWRCYSKFDLPVCIQKTKANLYQKGYPMELIQQFLDEKEEEIE